ncbi:multidrug efflux system membrane fusion protein [Luteibacter sp. OK325]|uniref:efflux RND transporter periplasmic adaptor subunit n=1 Tax=Luteibacter sp. OK325 TaxID=2135670 RepID=UPI000D376742|nr:efflux RND transporter periplasmic adaptor subunit [Luteibacter sp. OK325]PTR27297.1 multidrug efflux system membrane fusion protein [Luteibacter sp. OK325]
MTAIRKRLSVALGALLVVGGAAGIATYHGHEAVAAAHADAVAPAAEVDVATVISRTITEWQSYSGRLQAVDRVDIRPLVSGRIASVNFRDGSLVKKGDTLLTIDPAPYQAEVERASAQVAAADARAAYASTDAARAERLISTNAIARRDHDEKMNGSREAQANLKAARAALSAARINLAYTNVVAPVSGRVSRAELTVGNVVNAGASGPVLTTVVSVSPIYASFDVDEQTYLRYLRGDNGATIPVALGLADESGYSQKGVVDSVDNQLDTVSGTIRVRARFDNADGSLVPGLYARLKVGGGRPHEAILIDDAAVGTDQAKKYVLVVDEGNKVQYREVLLGDLHEGLRIVTSGLKPGERVVVHGVQRARPNEVVKPTSVDMSAVVAAVLPSA